MANTTQILYPATEAKATALRDNLALCGVTGARVRRMPNGSARVVIRDKDQRDDTRDALVLSDACTASGLSFAAVDSVYAWNGATEVFVRFLK